MLAIVTINTSKAFKYDPRREIVRGLLQCGKVLDELEEINTLANLTENLLCHLNLSKGVVDSDWLLIYGLVGTCMRRQNNKDAGMVLMENVVAIKQQSLAEDDHNLVESQVDLVWDHLSIGKSLVAVDHGPKTRRRT